MKQNSTEHETVPTFPPTSSFDSLFKNKRSYLCWDVVNVATLATPPTPSLLLATPPFPLPNPDFRMEQQSKYRDSAAQEATEAICSWGNRDSWLCGWKEPGPRAAMHHRNTESILFPPPATPGLGPRKAFRMNNGWKTLASQQWEMWHSTPTLTRVTREPACVPPQRWDTSQADCLYSGLSLHLQKNRQKSQRGFLLIPHL